MHETRLGVRLVGRAVRLAHRLDHRQPAGRSARARRPRRGRRGRRPPAAAGAAAAPPLDSQRAAELERRRTAAAGECRRPRRARQPVLRRRALSTSPFPGTRPRSSSIRRTSTPAPTSASATTTSNQVDRALAQIDHSLTLDPKHVKTLLNQGIVRAFGKKDLAGARRVLAEGHRACARRAPRRSAPSRASTGISPATARPGRAGRRPQSGAVLVWLLVGVAPDRADHPASCSGSFCAAVRAASAAAAQARPRAGRVRRSAPAARSSRSAVRHLHSRGARAQRRVGRPTFSTSAPTDVPPCVLRARIGRRIRRVDELDSIAAPRRHRRSRPPPVGARLRRVERRQHQRARSAPTGC